jgi:hypothetical protein
MTYTNAIRQQPARRPLPGPRNPKTFKLRRGEGGGQFVISSGQTTKDSNFSIIINRHDLDPNRHFLLRINPLCSLSLNKNEVCSQTQQFSVFTSIG